LFRDRGASPDLPATLVESILLGTPPIVSNVLYSKIFSKYNYPLVVKDVTQEAVSELIDEYASKEKYMLLMNTLRKISKELKEKYSYDINVCSKRLMSHFE
jgi:hypothetical protein